MALLIAASTLSLGMFTAFEFCTAVRNLELVFTSPPPAFTAITISLPKRVNCTAILAQRLNFLSLRNSNALPIVFNSLLMVHSSWQNHWYEQLLKSRLR